MIALSERCPKSLSNGRIVAEFGLKEPHFWQNWQNIAEYRRIFLPLSDRPKVGDHASIIVLISKKKDLYSKAYFIDN